MYYSKEVLRKAKANPRAQKIYYDGEMLEQRAWNRYVAGFIIDDFLSAMCEEDALEFMQYMSVLTAIQVGMFDTASRFLGSIIPVIESEGLKEKAQWLADMLANSDEVKG